MTREKPLGSLKVLESLMVGVDQEWLRACLQKRVPVPDSLDHRQELPIMRAISPFDLGHLSRPESDRAEAISMPLRQYSANRKARGVGF
jgi:hypothetical protein